MMPLLYIDININHSYGSSLVGFLTLCGILTSVDLDQVVKHFLELRDSVSYSEVLNISLKFHSDVQYIGTAGKTFSDLSKVDK